MRRFVGCRERRSGLVKFKAQPSAVKTEPAHIVYIDSVEMCGAHHAIRLECDPHGVAEILSVQLASRLTYRHEIVFMDHQIVKRRSRI